MLVLCQYYVSIMSVLCQYYVSIMSVLCQYMEINLYTNLLNLRYLN